MMLITNILLGFVAALLLLFVIGQTNPPTITDKQRLSAAIAFVPVVLLIIAFNTIM